MTSLLIVLSLIFFATISYLRLDWGIFIILAALPTYLIRFHIGPIPSTLLETMLLILFVVFLIKDRPWRNWNRLNFHKKRKNYPYHWEIIMILIFAALAVATSHYSDSALGIFKAYFLEPIMLYIILIRYGKGRERQYIWALALGATLISAVAIFQQITGLFIFNASWEAAATRRVTSLFPYPNAVGLYLGPIIFLLSGVLFSYPKRTLLKTAFKKIFLILVILVSIAAIFFARSEGAMIGLAAAFIATAFLYSKRGKLLSISAVIAGIIVLSVSGGAWHYFQKKATLMDLSGQIRRQQWKETMMMLRDGRLLSGAGLDGYQKAVAPFHQDGIFVKNDDPDWYRKVVWDPAYKKKVWQPVEIYLYPHNIFLNFWTEIGLMGALAFSWLIIRFLIEAILLLKKLDRRDRAITLGLIGAMITLLVHGMVDVPYFKNDLAILFWLMIALFGIIKLENKD